jgi:tetratricopeptide (TPR) repeat protein
LADTLARLDLQWRERPANRAGAQLLLAGLAAAGGRWSAARERFRTAETMEGAGPVFVYRAIAATLPLQPVSPQELRTIRDEVERWDPGIVAGGTLAGALEGHNRQYLLGLLASRLGDGQAAEQAAAAIENLPAPPGGRLLARSLAATVRADVSWMRNRPEDVLKALGGVDHRIPLELIALARPAHVREFGLEHARYLRAVALAALGRDAEALTWFRFGLRGSPQEYLYLGPVHVQLGELFERMAQPDSGAAHNRKFLELWGHADSAAIPLLETVRRRVTRSGTEPS